MACDIPELKATQADLNLLNELFAFEGSEPLTDLLVYKLIRQGFNQALFDQIQKIASHCEHGGVEAYYSKKRNSILMPGDEPLTTIEITKTHTHFHALPAPPF
jgi:hypothetical protein